MHLLSFYLSVQVDEFVWDSAGREDAQIREEQGEEGGRGVVCTGGRLTTQ